MRVPSHPTQIRRMLDSRLKQLVPAGPVLAASLTRVNKRCGQPVLLLPPRRPVAPGPPPHLQGGGQDTHRLRAPGPARGGPNHGCKNTNASRP